MSKIIFSNNLGFSNCRKTKRGRNFKGVAERTIYEKNDDFDFGSGVKSRGSAGRSILGSLVFLFLAIVGCGAFYLYQVNDLATKGFEIKEYENRLKELEKENKKMKIREVELRSMYHLEESTRDMDLVVPKSMTYLELKSPVAMK